MSTIPKHLRYSPEHQWAQLSEDDHVLVGITDHAQEALGDVVFIDLPPPGREVRAGKPMFTIESVKAASDVYAPISGVIKEVNPDLKESPEEVNAKPYDTWLVKITPQTPTDFEKLLKPEEYASIIGTSN